MKSTAGLKWAGVEFQPDLQRPGKKPVRLGVVLLSASGDILILGRQPILDRLPSEFNDVGTLTLELAANWVDNMAKDLLEADPGNPFGRLHDRWRWNLYLMKPVGLAPTADDLLVIAKRMYKKFVGEQFNIPSRRAHQARPRRRATPAPAAALPAAWLVAEIMRRRFRPLAATA